MATEKTNGQIAVFYDFLYHLQVLWFHFSYRPQSVISLVVVSRLIYIYYMALKSNCGVFITCFPRRALYRLLSQIAYAICVCYLVSWNRDQEEETP